MNIPKASRGPAERRDRALALRRKITTVVGAVGVSAVGVIGYLVAQSTTPTTVQIVSAVTSLGDDTVTGDDGAQRVSATSLSPGTATAGSAGRATTVTGGSTVVKKP
jgi:hypothetical protein